MKKTFTAILAFCLMITGLAACGKSGGDEAESVDLSAFWTQLEQDYEMPGMMDEASVSLADFYPGLEELSLRQQVVKIPMISSVVCEFVFIECENEADAQAAADILQARATQQAEGGAWYPASMEAWADAKIVTHGSYVALIAGGEYTDGVEIAFNALFA